MSLKYHLKGLMSHNRDGSFATQRARSAILLQCAVQIREGGFEVPLALARGTSTESNNTYEIINHRRSDASKRYERIFPHEVSGLIQQDVSYAIDAMILIKQGWAVLLDRDGDQ